jgi:hypothetical protein
MSWIVSAVGAEPGVLPQGALDGFRLIAGTYPAAPWKIENGHLRGCRARLEEISGHSWGDVALSPDQVQEEYRMASATDAAARPSGLTFALLAFLEVCATHRLSLQGGEGARLMPPTPRMEPRIERPTLKGQ